MMHFLLTEKTIIFLLICLIISINSYIYVYSYTKEGISPFSVGEESLSIGRHKSCRFSNNCNKQETFSVLVPNKGNRLNYKATLQTDWSCLSNILLLLISLVSSSIQHLHLVIQFFPDGK